MNQSIITGLGTPQLSRIIEEGDEYSRRTGDPSLFNPTQRKSHDQDEEEWELDRIESEISDIGKQLQSLHLQMKRMLDKYSQEYMEKEARRNTLRKRLIDLDFSHKMIFAKRMRKNNANSIIHQFYDSKVQHCPTPPRSAEKLPAKDKNEATSERANKFASPAKSYKAEDVKSAKKQLQESQRRIRISEIQLQLGEEKLRRSRVEQLTRQLMQLRATYSYPYLPDYYYTSYSSYSGWGLY